MASKNKYKKRNNIQVKRYSDLYMIPLILIHTLIPLIIRYHEYKTYLTENRWFPDSEYHFDFFLYYKQVYFIVISSLMLLIVSVQVYKDRKNIKSIKLPYVLIPLAVYALLALLSSILSDNTKISFRGMLGHFESVWVLLAYCIVVVYAVVYVKDKLHIEYFLKYVLIGTLIMCLIGILQFVGLDPVSSELGMQMILPKAYWPEMDSFNFRFGKNAVFLTLFNPNYVGVYVALVAPFMLSLAILRKSIKEKILYSIAFIGLVICGFGSKSDAGIIGLAVSMLLLIIFLRKQIFIFKWIKVTSAIICLALLCITIIKYPVIKNVVNVQLQPSNNNLVSINTEEELIINYKNNILNIGYVSYDNGYIPYFKDADGMDLAFNYNIEDNSYTIIDERFNNIIVAPASYQGYPSLVARIDEKDWYFTNQLGDGTFYYINVYGKFDKIKTADSAILNDYGRLASGRGYIWSRTLPLLKDNIILGTGADLFILEFPHQDYVNLYNYGFEGELMTKPHNMYLQIAIQTGLLSLIAFLVFVFMYLVTSIKLYIKGEFDTITKGVGVSILLGIIGYLVVGITNDSTITVAPVFWCLMGVGIAINRIVKNEDTANKELDSIK